MALVTWSSAVISILAVGASERVGFMVLAESLVVVDIAVFLLGVTSCWAEVRGLPLEVSSED
jgi:hypothetical protein